MIFQSTPSAWRETLCQYTSGFSLCHFNPLPPHGGRRIRRNTNGGICYFNPLPPHGGRPILDIAFSTQCFISIHSLRMEGDLLSQVTVFSAIYFNPLPPHGGRLCQHDLYEIRRIFQSTPSAWRETYYHKSLYFHLYISIHSLRMEGDMSQRIVCVIVNDFNPLPPHGGRPIYKRICRYFTAFQSTPSAWRETKF